MIEEYSPAGNVDFSNVWIEYGGLMAGRLSGFLGYGNSILRV